MTMSSSRITRGEGQPHTRDTSPIEWTAVQSGLWVGKVNGEFAGMVEAQWGRGFVATTKLAKTLGVFDTVRAAQASFDES
jgi:hypothetical protein